MKYPSFKNETHRQILKAGYLEENLDVENRRWRIECMLQNSTSGLEADYWTSPSLEVAHIRLIAEAVRYMGSKTPYTEIKKIVRSGSVTHHHVYGREAPLTLTLGCWAFLRFASVIEKEILK